MKGKSKSKSKKSVTHSLNDNQKKEVRHLITRYEKKRVERKQFAAARAFNTWSVIDGPFTAATPGVYNSNLTAGIVQGIGDDQRIGDMISLESIHIKLGLYNFVGVNANTWVNFRVIVYQYKSESSTPLMAELFLSSAANVGNTTGTYSPRNIDNMGIYTMLYDKIIHTEQGQPNAANFGQTGQLFKFVKFSVPLRYAQRRIQYQAGGPVTNNGIYLAIMTDLAATGVGSDPSFSLDYSLRYTDQ